MEKVRVVDTVHRNNENPAKLSLPGPQLPSLRGRLMDACLHVSVLITRPYTTGYCNETGGENLYPCRDTTIIVYTFVIYRRSDSMTFCALGCWRARYRVV